MTGQLRRLVMLCIMLIDAMQKPVAVESRTYVFTRANRR
jgi:hypothetical protein